MQRCTAGQAVINKVNGIFAVAVGNDRMSEVLIALASRGQLGRVIFLTIRLFSKS